MRREDFSQSEELTKVTIIISIFQSISDHPNLLQEEYDFILNRLNEWLGKCRKNLFDFKTNIKPIEGDEKKSMSMDEFANITTEITRKAGKGHFKISQSEGADDPHNW